MEVLLTVFSLAAISILSCLAVFHPAYDDTLAQRISLSGLCIGSLACIPLAINDELPSQAVWVSICGAIYALSTARKALKFYCAKP